MAEWQTLRSQKPVRLKSHGGSTPLLGTMSEKYNESLEKALKKALKKRFPQGSNLPQGLPPDSPPSDLAWEQHAEMGALMELTPQYNPKTWKLIQILSRKSEPE